jgi:hypothetical protein
MTLTDIKQIPIRKYLADMGINPIKNYVHYAMYFSPFRPDQNASFKVDFNKNLWHDFGTGEGGTVIDLVMKLENCSFLEVASKLEKQVDNFPFQGTAFSDEKKNNDAPAMQILDIRPLVQPTLLSWIRQRGIDFSLANLYCREIHYFTNGKKYFSIGFGNDKGGYELSSPPNFKSCIAPKEITIIQNNQPICLVFEGFWDFLSYLKIQKIEQSKHDIAVLNSVANVQKAMPFLKSHREIYTYLDTDEAGKKATEQIKSAHSNVHNRSGKFAEYKDLNDYLCGKKMAQAKPKKKGFKI